ncbi:hypothetical protein [Lacticaseibacillus paracasei]|uniref:hypothetical protein n=1 Tax=Lacticaseibacillus paracasei TaxID=1597 RepID=UPI00051699AB|nr:hypothetical protein [Lacticaseibacillus paracasei]
MTKAGDQPNDNYHYDDDYFIEVEEDLRKGRQPGYGNSLKPWQCPACGTWNGAANDFCDSCGEPRSSDGDSYSSQEEDYKTTGGPTIFGLGLRIFSLIFAPLISVLFPLSMLHLQSLQMTSYPLWVTLFTFSMLVVLYQAVKRFVLIIKYRKRTINKLIVKFFRLVGWVCDGIIIYYSAYTSIMMIIVFIKLNR